MRFGVYFETKMAQRNNYSLFALIYARGSEAYATQENLKIWCSLLRFGVYFDKIVS